MNRVRFLEIAQTELDEAVDYYNLESSGLGYELLHEIVSAVERIKRFPLAWHSFTKNTRRCRTHRFPYGIVYQILEEEILVIAIANLHRRPDYWHDRL